MDMGEGRDPATEKGREEEMRQTLLNFMVAPREFA
jgi:hypothetical protein